MLRSLLCVKLLPLTPSNTRVYAPLSTAPPHTNPPNPKQNSPPRPPKHLGSKFAARTPKPSKTTIGPIPKTVVTLEVQKLGEESSTVLDKYVSAGNLHHAVAYTSDLMREAEPRPKSFRLRPESLAALVKALVSDLPRGSPRETRDVPIPGYPWLPPDGSTIKEPVLPRRLEQALHLLHDLGKLGAERPSSDSYAAVIHALVERHHLEEATRLYALLVLGWNARVLLENTLGEEKRRAVTNLLRSWNMVFPGLEVPQITALSLPHYKYAPFPSAELLQPITTYIETSLKQHSPPQPPPVAPSIRGASAPLPVERPPGIVPNQHPELFRALEGTRVLSTLLFTKRLPYTTYLQFAPILHLMRLVPEHPRYTVEVFLPESEDKKPDWKTSQTLDKRLYSEGGLAPHVFRTSLYRFVRTILPNVAGGRTDNGVDAKLSVLPLNNSLGEALKPEEHPSSWPRAADLRLLPIIPSDASNLQI